VVLLFDGEAQEVSPFIFSHVVLKTSPDRPVVNFVVKVKVDVLISLQLIIGPLHCVLELGGFKVTGEASLES
jgi:hypothetical protein